MPVEDEQEKLDENAMMRAGDRYVIITHPENIREVKKHTRLPVVGRCLLPRLNSKGEIAAYEIDWHQMSPLAATREQLAKDTTND